LSLEVYIFCEICRIDPLHACITSLVVSPKGPKWAISRKQKPHRRNLQAQAIAGKAYISDSPLLLITLDYLNEEEGMTWRI